VVCLLTISCRKNLGHSPTLEETVKRMLNPSTFDLRVMDSDASVVFASKEGSHEFYDVAKLDEIATKIKASGTKAVLSNFVVLNADHSGQFSSITYKFDWTISEKDKSKTFHLLSHEIWEHQTHGWRRLYAAIEE
jgi:hypothetical protein